ncbi:Strictosidine synthase [Amycolatopsis xylanica]|uniref:Strictosidine synthase n=1 Tax=Amycolatopsis xylanica TaxID=589385 RepID=A0A1H3N0F8_9PSEU|nr:SMP-30/gluconolactonase/LRE family protein [Amycolatopsis xylanica]SDY82326.1 Strictosidine synthase [Amycolatopsis xylanica]
MRFGEVKVIPVGGHGPEDVVVDAEGQVYTGLADGRILRLSPDGSRIEKIAHTGGRPLGLELHGEDELLVCDANLGLLTVGINGGKVTTLATEALGLKLVFCNNAAVAQDGTIYFTDSSRRFPITHWRDDLIEQTAGGRLLRRDTDGTIDLVADGLQFANGVALPPDESFVAVAETGSFKVTRVWLTGEKAGTVDTLLDDLPGFPDNISTGSDGLIWVTQASPKVPALDVVRKLPSPLRSLVRSLPPGLQPAPKREVGVLGVAADGTVERELRGEIDGWHMLTGVREHGGKLYFGSLDEPAIAMTSV